MPAAVFIVTDFIDGKIELWWDQIEFSINNTADNEIEIDTGDGRLHFYLRDAREREHALKHLLEYCKTIPQDRRCELVERINRILNVNRLGDQEKTPRAISLDQVKEMLDNGVEFFPHTMTHPILTRCREEVVMREISESKRKVESIIGRPADIFCYPNGRLIDLDDRVIALLRRSGYTAAFTAVAGYDYIRGKIDFFRLRRYPFPEDFIDFKRIVSGVDSFISVFKKI
jgi:peptidoglycan/xylan/chitin deacetylase (PgdA/CDA1 family)